MRFKDKVISFLKIFYKGFGAYKRQIVFLTFLGFFGSVLEGIGINALIPMFSFITGQGEGGNDTISRAIKSFFDFFHVNFSVKYILIFICLLFVLKALLIVFSNYMSARITAGYEAQSRSHLFKNTLKASWPFLLKQKLGHLQTLLMTNITSNSVLLGYIGIVATTLASLIVYVFVAVNISFYITCIALISSAFMLLVYQPVIDKTRKLAYEQEAINRQIGHHVNENILGMKTVKTMSVEDKVEDISGDFFDKLRMIKIKSFLLSSMPGSLSEPFSLIFICVVFAISYKTPNFNLAAFAAVIYLIKQIFAYAQQLNKYLMAFNTQIPYLRRVLDYQDQTIFQREENLGKNSFVFEKGISFENVSFSYEGGVDILDKANFDIKKGEMVGLIGPSGSGKTTIVDLILRLFEPTVGRITLDGKDIKEVDLKDWRTKIGYVAQDIFLKNDTIANNIRFYDPSLTEEDIIQAAKMANIWEFIESCPEKLETKIGERGMMLSAGQRQRIILARILAQNPEFLVLDEATSALDNESEMQIQQVIENLKGKITILAIAHRLSTVINFDRIMVVDQGQIIEQGAPEELLKNEDTYFFKMFNLKEAN